MPTKGTFATYSSTSTIDLRSLIAGTTGESIWNDDKPLNLRIATVSTAWSASWTSSNEKERYRLLRHPGGGLYLIHLASRSFLQLDKLPALHSGSGAEVSWRDADHSKFGPLRRAVVHLALSGGQTATVTIDAQPQGAGTSASLTHLWLALAPWLGKAAATLGLPVSMRLELAGDPGRRAELTLNSLDAVDLRPDAFDLPSGLNETGRQSHRWRLKRSSSPPPPDSGSPTAARPPLLFTGMGPETVKVIVHQSLIDSTFADARAASSYISGFSGTRFTFPTSDWFTQIVTNAPVPVDGEHRSVIPALMVRAFLGEICPKLHALNLTQPPPDAATIAAALPQTDEMKRLRGFLSAVAARSGPLSAFAVLLNRIVEEDDWLPILTADLDNFRNHPFVILAEVWYGLLLPSVNVRPKYRTRQEMQDAVAVFHPNGEVTIDKLAELVDINLNDFEHSIMFGNRPLFTQPVYVDTAALRVIGQLQPWFRQLQDIRFGFLTELSLAGAEVSCNIDITPALTPVTVVMGFFCPPCVLSLFMTGNATASIEDARFPVFLYVEQDPLRINPPRWRTVFAEPQFGDVDANIFVIGFNVILVEIIDVIGNAAGGFVLEEILKSFGSELSDAVDGILSSLPVLDAGTIARLGRDPSLIFPQAEDSHVAYEAPHHAADGYQFETFRQAVRGTGEPLEFPPAGATLDASLALVLGPQRASKLSTDITWPSHFGPFNTRKPDSSVSEIDWWTEAPDQTGMPPRPPQAPSGPPPGVLLIPQNVGQSWWTFNTILDVHLAWLGWRDLTDSPADQPAADVTVSAWCRGEAIETEIIMYEECQDVTHLAEGLLDRWRGPRGPIGPVGLGDPVGPIEPGGPGGMLVSGRFLRRAGRPDADGGGFGPGWGDSSSVGYWFDPRGRTPRPDDAGPTPVPGTMICRDIVTLNGRQRVTWVEASLQFSLPVHVGLTEILEFQHLDGFHFLPAIRSALSETYPAAQSVNLNLFATGPLQTLNRPANRNWIRDLLLSISTDLAATTGINRLGPFRYDYGLDTGLLTALVPEHLAQPQLLFRLASVTTSPAGAPLKRVAFKFQLQQSLLGRA